MAVTLSNIWEPDRATPGDPGIDAQSPHHVSQKFLVRILVVVSLVVRIVLLVVPDVGVTLGPTKS